MSQGRENEVGEDAGNRRRDARDADEREAEREPRKGGGVSADSDYLVEYLRAQGFHEMTKPVMSTSRTTDLTRNLCLSWSRVWSGPA